MGMEEKKIAKKKKVAKKPKIKIPKFEVEEDEEDLEQLCTY